jgi:hypothetical protein
MLGAFYGAFSPACFALLGLWLVVVQIRLREWQGSPPQQRRSYGVALHFALPGIMSLLALVDLADPVFWRVSFAVIALGGAVVVAMVGRSPARSRPTPGEPAPGEPGHAPVADQLGVAAYLAAIALYLLIGALAVVGGLAVLRAEAVLLTLLVFLGFNVAWLLLFDSKHVAPPHPRAAAH